MKTAICVFFLFLCVTAAFSQNGPVLSNEVQPFQMVDHPRHASEHAMATETSLFGSSSYSYAKGEVPLAELASPTYTVPLGDLARTAKKEHANLPKAAKVSENQ